MSMNSIETGQKQRICVVGLGYVGLPTAIAFHDAGFSVIGIDKSMETIRVISSGRSHLKEENSEIEVPTRSEKWEVTTNYNEAIPKSDIILITVPTPTNHDKTPNLNFVESAFDSVMSNIARGSSSIIVLESTVFPGATREVAKKIADIHDLEINVDYRLAYSPERVSPGDLGRSAKDVARIVGAADSETGILLESLYGEITNGGCTYVGEIEIAEAAKMIENTQRDIDIAFANELAITLPAMGLDVMDVMDAASTKWNFHRHDPGIGVGGHCIPVDPYYYIDICRENGVESRISPIARSVNESMPGYAAETILEKIGEDSNRKVLILGYSYKPGVGDTRETPVNELVELLISKNAKISIFDPHVEKESFPEKCEVVEHPYNAVNDIIVVATAHKEIMELDWKKMSENCSSRVIYDGRRCLNKEEMAEMGWAYLGIGM